MLPLGWDDLVCERTHVPVPLFYRYFAALLPLFCSAFALSLFDSVLTAFCLIFDSWHAGFPPPLPVTSIG